MKINVLSKIEFEDLMINKNIDDSNVESLDTIMFISILNTDSVGDNIGHFKHNHKNVLILNFDDVEFDIIDTDIKAVAFTEEQGHQLMSFIDSNKDKNQCIVHCSAGISRSGAVGAFISDYFNQSYASFKKINPYTKPNPRVMRIMNRILRQKE